MSSAEQQSDATALILRALGQLEATMVREFEDTRRVVNNNEACLAAAYTRLEEKVDRIEGKVGSLEQDSRIGAMCP